ncbi:hypothetical protein E2C01_059759 [Portunus trituberculatus]|uniref:Uncharacterized protein n=1 Tax=Portunus trituberculatus TaxID=210409 RepID=A0A5B7GZA7_PORTR|nr:hypothetical protein [Portunus trituberculatus]
MANIDSIIITKKAERSTLQPDQALLSFGQSWGEMEIMSVHVLKWVSGIAQKGVLDGANKLDMTQDSAADCIHTGESGEARSGKRPCPPVHRGSIERLFSEKGVAGGITKKTVPHG